MFNSWDQDLYAYVHGNPINSWDPTGQFSIADVLITTGIIGVLAGIYLTAGLARGNYTGPRTINGAGGMDITGPLLKTREVIMQKIHDLPQAKFDELLRQNSELFAGAANWDITELYQAGGGKSEGKVGPDVFAIGASVVGTVTVKGKVYEAPEVNYYLYGCIMRAIDERIGGSASFDSGMTKVVMYRGIRWFGAGTNGRAAWYKAGYFNIIEAAESAALPNVTPSLVSYNGTWFAWWGLTSNPNSYERVVEVTSREVGL